MTGRRRIVLRSVAIAASAIAGRIAFSLVASPMETDRLLTLLVAIPLVLAWLVGAKGRRWAHLLIWLSPLTIANALFVSDAVNRQVGYGIILAIGLAGGAAGTRRDSTWDRLDASILLAVALLPIRMLPFGFREHLPLLVVIGGAIAILFALGRNNRNRLPDIALALAAATVTSPGSMSGALFPATIAAALALVRRPSIASAVAAIVLAVVSGKSGAPILAAGVVATSFERLRSAGGAGFTAAPWIAGPLFPFAFLRGLAWAPSVVTRSVPAGAIAGAMLLAIVASLGGPEIAVQATVAAVALLFPTHDASEKEPHVTIVALTLLFPLFFAWSGLFAVAFPFVASFTVVVVTGLIGVAATRIPRPFVAAAVSSAIAVVALATAFPDRHVVTIDRAATEGRPISIPIHPPLRDVTLSMRAAHVERLAAGTVIGTVEARGNGRSVSRALRVGEIADWGAFRSEARRRNRNPLPVASSGRAEGSGTRAFPTGSGMISIRFSEPVREIVVSANPEIDDPVLHVEHISGALR